MGAGRDRLGVAAVGSEGPRHNRLESEGYQNRAQKVLTKPNE